MRILIYIDIQFKYLMKGRIIVSWTKEILGVDKPIIAMCHLQAMPGDPAYDKSGGMQKVVECAKRDLLALHEGGVDSVMFCNTGCTKETITDNLRISDGIVVGTTFKKEGVFENFVDVKRVKEFMNVVRDSRK